jgi:hypothetical protein
MTIATKIDQAISEMDTFPGQPSKWLSLLYGILDSLDAQKTLMTVCHTFKDPDAASTTGKATQQDLTSPGAMAGIVQPDLPRNIKSTLTDANASITSLTVTIVGVDINGDAATEVLTHAAANTQTGNTAFATVTSITTAVAGGTAGAGDVLDIGWGVKFGLMGDYKAVVKVTEDDADTGTGDITIDTTYNTVVFESAPDGTVDFMLWYTSYFSSDTTDS